MKKFTMRLKMCGLLLLCAVFAGFSVRLTLDEQTDFIQKMLTDHYDDSTEMHPPQRHELKVTNSGFCRYKRFFKSGKTEYFSFNLLKFRNLDYYGTDKIGALYLRTKGDDAIVQTYNDREDGDIDSMAAQMRIPMKDLEPEDLNELSEKLAKMNAQLLAQQ